MDKAEQKLGEHSEGEQRASSERGRVTCDLLTSAPSHDLLETGVFPSETLGSRTLCNPWVCPVEPDEQWAEPQAGLWGRSARSCRCVRREVGVHRGPNSLQLARGHGARDQNWCQPEPSFS